jgi:tetratricopeptide (TPR) repeat protein
MSLLLDALKKAAEQKAQKSKAEPPVDRASDETLLDLGAGATAPAAGRNDATEFEHPEINARLERSSVVRGGGEDTGLELPDRTQIRARGERPLDDETGLDVPQGEEPTRADLSEQLQTGDDESIVFGSEDASDFVIEHDRAKADDARTQDETDLSQLIEPEESTAGGGPRVDEDETDLGQVGDLTAIGKPPAQRVEIAADDADEDSARGKMQAAGEDESDSSQSLRDSAGGAGQARTGDSAATDIKLPTPVAEPIETVEAQRRSAVDGQSDADEASVATDSGGGLFDEDLSLLLLEPDPTNPRPGKDSVPGSAGASGETGRAFAAGAEDAEELALVDTTQTRTRAEQTDAEEQTLTNPSETALYEDETRTVDATGSRSNTGPRDATSTRTYAPDNYDRTLMKLPSDDASKLFAGMKSDSDVVMTPDYAKKVFRSKTSAQRIQHYKLYGAIAVVIMLSIGIYGLFEYQDESFQIDTSLQPLKRDPMPGVIKKPRAEETSLFDGSNSELTARTIEIIETAETAETAESAQADDTAVGMETGKPDSVEAIAIIAPQATAPAITTPAATGSGVESAPAASARAAVPQGQVAQGNSVDPAAAPAEPQATAKPAVKPVAAQQVASLSPPEPKQSQPQQPAATTSNLQIETSTQYRQSDVWLREAYAAYSAGDDQQALRLYNQVVKADPGNRNALLARAAIYIHNGDIDAAIRDYQTLLLANPKDSLALASLLAVASLSPLETETQLKLMIYDEPDSPFLNFALANAYGAQNRWQEAQQYYFKALQTNPQDPNYAYNLAVSLEHISQPASAVTYYRRALDNFDNGLATFNRELVIQRLERLKNL